MQTINTIRKKMILMAAAILTFAPVSLIGQVTIGSTAKPVSGALLQLKENEVPNGEANSTRGLLLPRVLLTDYNSLNDLGTGLDPDEHVGLTVYSVSEVLMPSNECESVEWADSERQKGIYVWSGTEWVSLLKKSEGVGSELVPPSWLGEGVELVTDVEGNAYFTMDFGTAGRWMTQNMRSKTFDTEAVIAPEASSGVGADRKLKEGIYNKALAYYAYPVRSNQTYVVGSSAMTVLFDANPSIGLVYNHGGAWGDGKKPIEVTGVQGICPNGWHIPTKAEWDALRTEVLDASRYTKYAEKHKNDPEGTAIPMTNLLLHQRCTFDTGTNGIFGGYSKPVWKGGFAMNYLGVMQSSTMTDPHAANGSIFWTSSQAQDDPLRPGVAAFIPTSDINAVGGVVGNGWSDNFDRTMTGVRCKKNTP